MCTSRELHVSAQPFHFHPLSIPNSLNFFWTFDRTGPAYEMMKRCNLNEKADGSFNFFPTIHDAVHQAMDNLMPISVITDN